MVFDGTVTINCLSSLLLWLCNAICLGKPGPEESDKVMEVSERWALCPEDGCKEEDGVCIMTIIQTSWLLVDSYQGQFAAVTKNNVTGY